MAIFHVLLFLISAGNVDRALSQQLPSTCPDPAPMALFDAAKFAGLWFTQQKSETGLRTECDQIKYELKSDTKLRFSGFSMLRASGILMPVSGCAEVQNNTGILKVKVKVQSQHRNSSIPYEIRVLATDYEQFALLWSCRDASSHVVIYTREKEPSTAVIATATKFLEEQHFSESESQLVKSCQKKCPQYKFFASDERDGEGTAVRMGGMIIRSHHQPTTPAYSDE